MKKTTTTRYSCKSFFLLAALAAVLFLKTFEAHADSLGINFDSAPYPTNAPNNFLAAGPMQSYGVAGQYSISGGALLGNPTFLLAFTTNNGGSFPNVYGTADIGDPSLSSNIVLQINPALGAYHVSGVLFNGQPIPELYGVDAYNGTTLLYSSGGLVPANTSTNGFLFFNLVSDVDPITSVVFSSLNPELNGWDFFLDSIDITVTTIPEPQPVLLMGAGLALLGWCEWRNRRKMNRLKSRRVVPLALLASSLMTDRVAQAATVWSEQGPGPINRGQSEAIGYAGTTNPVAGAINAIVLDPNDFNTIYLATVNGGVWVTHNASAIKPNYIPLTDLQLPSLSIASLAMDPTDANTLFAGTGSSSSFSSDGNAGIGVARTTDAGATWTLGGTNNLIGKVINSVVAAGGSIVLATTTDSGGPAGGIYRSTDNGDTFTNVLPIAGGFCNVVSDPRAASRFYAASPGNGVYRSDDSGATWNQVNTGLTGVAGYSKILLSVNKSASVAYCMAITNGHLLGVFRSVDLGTNWTNLGVPAPEIFPGGQGNNQGAVLADLNNTNVVFVAGDRQNTPFPNVNGCNAFSANIFRGDAAQPPAGRWQTVVGNGAQGSSPHADSRALIYYDVGLAGTILHAGDGGLSRLADPNNTIAARRWIDDNGNIRPTEFHSVAYDSVHQIVFGGAQDVGTPMQTGANNFIWNEQFQGDGGKVAVDSTSTPGTSIRYSCFFYLAGMARTTWTNNVCVATNPVILLIGNGANSGTNLNALNVNSKPDDGGDGGDEEDVAPIVSGVQFYNPYTLNIINPSRMLVGTSNAIYESFDKGDNLTDLGINTGFYIGTGSFIRGAGSSPIAYGSRFNGAPRPDVYYVGTGNYLIHRVTAGGPNTFPQLPVGCIARSVVMDPQNYKNVYVLDYFQRIFVSFNEGTNWINLTANLTNLCSDIRCIEIFSPTNTPLNTVLAAGGQGGVFQMRRPAAGGTIWTNLGTGLPHALFLDLHFDYANSVLVAGSLGRGAWTVQNFFRGDGSLLPSPYLTIEQSGVNVILSWPVAVSGYVLEASSDMTGWSPVSATVEPEGANNFVTVPITSQSQFYRLKHTE